MLIPSCLAMPLTTNSEAFKNIQKNLEVQSENNIKIAKVLDKVTEKIGLDTPSLSLEFKDALAKLQSDNDKKYELLDAKYADIAKKLLEMGGSAMGIPAPLTAGVIGLVSTYGGKMVSDVYANRRRERDAQQHAEELAEQEEEKEKIRLRLEKEKEEMRQKALIKQRTMAKVNPAYQVEYDRCNAEAIAELKARGEI